MASIKVLPKETVELIAAGEVVIRPSAVVKELIENSIDAGANNISIEIKDGGVRLIRVTDNGRGMNSEDLPLAFIPHATSKISKIDDLETLHTFGFRGEALASICAVSKCEVITKQENELTGLRYEIEGGVEKSITEVGAPCGTTIIARDLFYNTPARLKFLKSFTTESSYVSEVVENAVLSYPSIAFSLIVNGRNVIKSSGNGDLSECIFRLYGKDAYDSMLPIDFQEENMHIYGLYAKPEYFKANRNSEKFFVNLRPVKSRIISKAVESSYDSYLMNHQFPFVVIFIDLPADEIDVNVHPQKSEIRFNEEQKVHNIVYNAVLSHLKSREMIKTVTLDKKVQESENLNEDIIPEKKDTTSNDTSKEAQKVINQEADKTFANIRYAEPFETKRLVKENAEYLAKHPVVTESKQLDLFEEKLLSANIRDEYHIIGQVFDTYWMVSYKDTMLIIDQHAAHEKVLFERFYSQINNNSIVSQLCSPSIILTLSGIEESVLIQNMGEFQKAGFEIEHFGGRDYALKAVPEVLKTINEADLFKEMLSDIENYHPKDLSKTIYDRIATMACKAAVKGNMRLSYEEATALIYELLELDNPYHCPHGRPTIIKMTKDELEKKFKRIL